MKTLPRTAAALVLIGLAGCSKMLFDTLPADATLRFVSGVHGQVNVLVDGAAILQNISLGSAVQAGVSSGTHSLVIEKVGGASSSARMINLAVGGRAIVVAFDSSGAPGTSLLVDSNTVVPAGATKLRVAHYAAAASTIDIWRTQPDYGTPIRIQFPFNYQDVSPYLQSTVGDWRVMVSHPIPAATPNAPMPDTLANSGALAIASGASKTVIVVDGAAAGTVQIVVMEP
jgi:hypothetical protein